MASTDVAVRPRRSAFAAAFLSFLFPGLGHAYIGRWLRALLWAVLPILGIAAAAGLALSPDRSDYLTVLADPDVLVGVLLFLVFDFFYRLIALLDAYRLASDPEVGNAASRMLSAAGLVAVIAVLAGSHVVAAQPIFLVTDTFTAITENAGDESEIVDIDELAAEDTDFLIITEDLQQIATPDPDVSPGASPALVEPVTPPTAVPATPTATLPTPPEPEVDVAAEPTPQREEWDGKKRLNILLIGSDGGRPGKAGSSLLTDTMIVVSVDPTTGRVAFISLPRDTAGVPLPRNWAASGAFGGKYNNKINTLYTIARGRSDLFPGNDKQRGYTALMGALGQLYGLDIDYYVSVNLNSFRQVVNTLGGVVVDVQLPVYDDGYPADDGRGKLKLYLPPGMARMNGQQALAYARSRHGSSDFDRSARQQRVITSVRDQTDIDSVLQPGVLSDLIKQVRRDIKTNIPPKLVPSMLSLAQKVDLDRRENLVLSSGRYVEVCYPCGPQGLWMLKAKPAAIKGAVQNVFSSSKKQARTINKIQEEGAVVHVFNGQGGTNGKAINIAANLAKKGVDAVVPPINGGKAETKDQRATLITVYNGAEDVMPETITRIKRALDDEGREIAYEDDPDQTADVVVTVGKKTEALKP